MPFTASNAQSVPKALRFESGRITWPSLLDPAVKEKTLQLFPGCLVANYRGRQQSQSVQKERTMVKGASYSCTATFSMNPSDATSTWREKKRYSNTVILKPTRFVQRPLHDISASVRWATRQVLTRQPFPQISYDSLGTPIVMPLPWDAVHLSISL